MSNYLKIFKMKKTIILLAVLLTVFVLNLNAQDSIKAYQFTTDKVINTTSVKNQYRSGTCWVFSGNSFFETEVMRLGKGPVDLSEMFVVHHIYSDKAIKYVRLHGHLNFGAGNEFYDVKYVLKNYGIVPESVYTGLNYGTDKPVHAEMDKVLENIVKAIVENPNKKLTPVWHDAFDKVLDTYLGEMPKEFTYKGNKYTPKSFMKFLGLNPDNYIDISSFTHHPFYQKFVPELPDNWQWASYYNLPLNEMMTVIDNAISKGYSVAWASDVSEKGFSWKNGIAILPDEDVDAAAGLESDKWLNMDKREKITYLYSLEHIVKEKNVTQESRQVGFDNYETTDDHGMQIVGIAHDQNGTKYYIIKNSWGVAGSPFKGFFYASEAFVKEKTTGIMVHKDVVPVDIAKKINLN